MGPILVGYATEPGHEGTLERVLESAGAALGEALSMRVETRLAASGADHLAEVLDGIPRAEPVAAIIVPLVVTYYDEALAQIAAAASDRSDVITAPPLGTGDSVIGMLTARVDGLDVPDDATMVIAVAGPHDEGSDILADALRAAWSGPVRVGAAGEVADAVAAARAYGEEGTVAIVSTHVTECPGQQELSDAGADVVTPPLADDPGMVALIVRRFSMAWHEATGG